MSAPRDGLAGDEAIGQMRTDIESELESGWGYEHARDGLADFESAVRAEAVAEEQRRITALLQAEVARYPETIGEGREGWALFARQCGVEDALNLVRAAGSVPVATPGAEQVAAALGDGE